MTTSEIEQAQQDVDKQLTALWQDLINASYDARAEWSQAAAPAVQLHERKEAYRGLLRVILRAW